MRPRSTASASASCTRSLTPIAAAGSSAGDRDHLVPGGAQHLDRVGQVVLALRVLGAQAPERGREQVAAEAVDRRVDLVDLALLDVGVGVLDDAGHPVVLVADHAAVAGRVGGGHGEHRRGGVLHSVLGGQHRDRLGAQQRVVARQHEDVVFGVEVVEGAQNACGS